MGRIYISSCNDSEMEKWGLFYDNSRGVAQHLTEDFKDLIFDSKSEAETKLELIESERRSEDAAVPFSRDEARAFCESHQWKFAKTYAKTAPHEYLVKKWLSEEDRLLFERLVQTIHTESCVLLERVSNRKADSYVKLNVKMEDYYRIKDNKQSKEL